ncbi:NF-kappa-B essential modulator, putative, partial [Perkinsus marinus ATCC 50983]
ASGSTKHWIDMIRRQQVICSNIDRELDVGQRELHKTQKRAAEVEQHIERYAVELSEEHAKYFAALDEVKAREARVSEIEKMVEKEEEKLQQQQALYDSVRADRNLYSKSLIDCNAEIEEMKRKFKIAFHRIEQVKSEVRKKEAKIVNVDLERTRIARGNNRIRESLDSGLERIQGLKCIVDVQKGESEKLKVVMEEAEGEVANYEKALESVVSERELLEKQLSNREAEVKKMYEKIRLLESDLRQGRLVENYCQH